MMDQEKIHAISIVPIFSPKDSMLKVIKDTLQAQKNHCYQWYICHQCQKWLQNQISITSNDKHYCVGCFSLILPSCETYSVNNGNILLEQQSNDWPLVHQLFLLNALQKWRFGNWSEIQYYMNCLGAKYSKKQLQAHYMKLYRKNFHSQQHTIGSPDTKNTIIGIKKSHRGGKNLKFQSNDMENFESQISSNSINYNCYNAKRKEFLVQYNQELENYICDMEFKPDDTAQQIQLKMQLLEAYNRKLSQRYEKQDFIIEHKLLNGDYQEKRKKQMEANVYLKTADQMLKPTMRYCKFSQYQQLTQNLSFCLKLQALIDGFRQLRSSNSNCSMESLLRLQKIPQKNTDNDGKPRKRVHRNENKKSDRGEALDCLGLTKLQLEQLLQNAKQQNQPFIYKGITVKKFQKL